jgi:hypothetical protein
MRLFCALAVLGLAVLAGLPGPRVHAAIPTLVLKSVTIDHSGERPGHGTWSSGNDSATWDVPDPGGWREADTWTFPQTIPEAGSDMPVNISVTGREARHNASIRLTGTLQMRNGPPGNELQVLAEAGETKSGSMTVHLLAASGSNLYVIVGIQDGPGIRANYEAEQTQPTPTPTPTPQPTPTASPTFDPKRDCHAKAFAAAINEVRVVSVKGDVKFHKEGCPDEQWLNVSKGSVLKQGDEISCDPDGVVVLAFADNSTVTLRATTQLKIASFFTEGGVVRTEILLKMGEVASKVNKSEATKSDQRIKQTTFTASVRGTEYTTYFDPSSKIGIVRTKEGVVEVDPVNPKLKTVLVPAGKEVEVGPKSMTKVVGTGKAGARGGVDRIKATEKVMKELAGCHADMPRDTAAFSLKPVKGGWAMSAKLVGKGTAKWKVLRGKARPANALARACR